VAAHYALRVLQHVVVRQTFKTGKKATITIVEKRKKYCYNTGRDNEELQLIRRRQE